jgi:hypothetical protein
MQPPKTTKRLITGFFLRLVLAYAAFMAAWPLLKTPYSAWHRTAGNACLSPITSRGVISFQRAPGNDPVRDTVIYIQDPQTPGAELLVPISARYTGYMPTAFTASLILATPIPWRRRFTALLIAMILVHVFILGWLTLSLIDEMSNPAAPFQLAQFTEMDKRILRFVVTNFVESVIATAYVVPIFIWIIAAFRRRDREQLLGLFFPPQPAVPPAPPTDYPAP